MKKEICVRQTTAAFMKRKFKLFLNNRFNVRRIYMNIAIRKYYYNELRTQSINPLIYTKNVKNNPYK